MRAASGLRNGVWYATLTDESHYVWFSHLNGAIINSFVKGDLKARCSLPGWWSVL